MENGWLEIRRIPQMPGKTPREAEGIAWREIVRERLGDVAISYNEKGAPVIDNGYISVSHTGGWVAVMHSSEPCAVDIELKTRKISPATCARMGIAPNIEAWCEYEARYKYASLAGVETSLGDIPAVRFHSHPELVVAIIASVCFESTK